MTTRCLRNVWSIRSHRGTSTRAPLVVKLQTAQRAPVYSVQWVPTRGARTKATVKFSDLPQGALPSAPLLTHEEDSSPAYPPVIQQHFNHVRQFSNCVVLTRVGNFYELYGEQAEQYGPLLNLKVAQRKTSLGPVAMSGFQFMYLDRYLRMLVQDLNRQVAISEEVRNSPADQVKAGGLLYTRKVSRVITAGTLIDENFMDPYENNFLLSVHVDDFMQYPDLTLATDPATTRFERKMNVGLAWVDLSSGDFFTQTTDLETLGSVVARIGAKEIVLNAKLESIGRDHMNSFLGEGNRVVTFHPVAANDLSIEQWLPMLERPIPESERPHFTPQELSAGSLLLDYVKGKVMGLNISLQCPVHRSDNEYMSIDKHTLRGLEIRTTLREGMFQGSLLHAIRRTVTKSGTRLLNQRLVSPSMSLSVINDRLDLVEQLLIADSVRSDITALLRRSSDTLRLLQKFSIGKGDADDLLALARTMEVTRNVFTTIERYIEESDKFVKPDMLEQEHKSLTAFSSILWRFDLEGPSRLAARITHAIDEDGLSRRHLVEEAEAASVMKFAEESSTEGADEESPRRVKTVVKASTEDLGHPGEDEGEIWIMRKHASATLRRAHADLVLVMAEKRELTTRLRSELGSSTLNLKWTPQLGHFCHVRGKDARATPSTARSISSTKSTRTFYLTEWTSLGSRLDDAKLRIRTEEQRVFNELRKEVISNMIKLRRNAAVLDELDVACSSATLAEERNLIKPILHAGTTHKIVAGRHPMVDVGLQEHGRLFTANDCAVGGKENILLITGPNMAGKSTFLRQNALISILAQTGCFVPAAYAEIGLVDKLFSRIGSADNVYNHQSTFMIEMLEVAEILNQATERSFVIMDEVGRGTTPEDGVAVGYACLHHLHNENKCRTLFATHFHTLVDMTVDFDRLACYCTAVAEQEDGSWVYVHKLRRGVNRDSHALKVARLAGE